MSGTGHILSSSLLICVIGVWLETPSMVVQVSCISQFAFCCISPTFVFGGRSINPFMDRGDTFPLMFAKLVMQATEHPCKMMEGMRLRFVHCAAGNILLHLGVY